MLCIQVHAFNKSKSGLNENNKGIVFVVQLLSVCVILNQFLQLGSLLYSKLLYLGSTEVSAVSTVYIEL